MAENASDSAVAAGAKTPAATPHAVSEPLAIPAPSRGKLAFVAGAALTITLIGANMYVKSAYSGHPQTRAEFKERDRSMAFSALATALGSIVTWQSGKRLLQQNEREHELA